MQSTRSDTYSGMQKTQNPCEVAPSSRETWSCDTATQPAKVGLTLKKDAEGVRQWV